MSNDTDDLTPEQEAELNRRLDVLEKDPGVRPEGDRLTTHAPTAPITDRLDDLTERLERCAATASELQEMLQELLRSVPALSEMRRQLTRMQEMTAELDAKDAADA